ncbi:MAG: hypothetical protein Q9199_006964 [Rusavskia elegans]
MDEAHGTGVLGPKGAGLVSALGLEKEIAIRLHTCGKAMASTGAVILGNSTVRNSLMNFARSVIYTTAPSFPLVAGIRAGYDLLKTGATQKVSEHSFPSFSRRLYHPYRGHRRITDWLAARQHPASRQALLKNITARPVWNKATEMGILSIPVSEDWDSRGWLAHCVPLWTRQRYNYWLVFHLQLSGVSAFPIDYPTVPKGQSRIRLMFHGANTEAEVETLVSIICDFAQEMIEIEESGEVGQKVPKAAQQVYALMADV